MAIREQGLSLQDMVVEFEKLVPPKSVLGYELRLLKDNRDKQKMAFESSTDKMAYDTSAYRRSNMAIELFLGEMLPRIRKAFLVADPMARERLSIIENHVQFGGFEKHRIAMDRRSEARIWQHYAMDCYRQKLRRDVRRLKAYRPDLVADLVKTWRAFRREIQNWKYERVPFDGSRAMHAMFFFIVKVDDLAAAHD